MKAMCIQTVRLNTSHPSIRVDSARRPCVCSWPPLKNCIHAVLLRFNFRWNLRNVLANGLKIVLKAYIWLEMLTPIQRPAYAVIRGPLDIRFQQRAASCLGHYTFPKWVDVYHASSSNSLCWIRVHTYTHTNIDIQVHSYAFTYEHLCAHTCIDPMQRLRTRIKP